MAKFKSSNTKWNLNLYLVTQESWSLLTCKDFANLCFLFLGRSCIYLCYAPGIHDCEYMRVHLVLYIFIHADKIQMWYCTRAPNHIWLFITMILATFSFFNFLTESNQFCKVIVVWLGYLVSEQVYDIATTTVKFVGGGLVYSNYISAFYLEFLFNEQELCIFWWVHYMLACIHDNTYSCD